MEHGATCAPGEAELRAPGVVPRGKALLNSIAALVQEARTAPDPRWAPRTCSR
jgi:hypothetical protein